MGPGVRRDDERHSRDSICPSFSNIARPKSEGAARPSKTVGAKMRLVVATGSPGSSRHSLRDGFTVSFVLSPVIGPSCHRRQRDARDVPGIIANLNASLEASGPHDFAVRTGAARQAAPKRPPHPVPRFVTIASRPSCGTRHYDRQVIWDWCQVSFGKSEISLSSRPPSRDP